MCDWRATGSYNGPRGFSVNVEILDLEVNFLGGVGDKCCFAQGGIFFTESYQIVVKTHDLYHPFSVRVWFSNDNIDFLFSPFFSIDGN